MTTMRSSIAALTSVALLAGTSLVFAQPHHDLHHPGPRSAKPGTIALAHRVQEEHKWGEAERKRAEAWRDKYMALKKKTWKKDRAAEEARERKQWGEEMWKHEEVKQEMELDAWRLARIAALLDLSQAEKREDLITKLNELRAREMARHNHMMDGYRTRWGHR